MNVHVVDLYHEDPTRGQAGLVAPCGWAKFPGRSYANKYVPVVLMFQRWDGRLGFFGGKVDPKDREAAKATNHKDECAIAGARESWEEGGFRVLPEALHHLLTHVTDFNVVRFYRYNLGAMQSGFMRQILQQCMACESVTLSEGCPVWVQLGSYENGMGWDVVINASNLMVGVREELTRLRECMYSDIPLLVGLDGYL